MTLTADSGSTKTDWCLAGRGMEVRRMATQGINPFHQDEAEIEAVIGRELMPQMTGDVYNINKVYFYGSGCREELVPMMTRTLGRRFPNAAVIEVHSDLVGAARAVCGRERGIACILGTGANSCLYDGQRVVMNTPPLGYILGDEGSGAVLGRLFIGSLYKGMLSKGLRDEFERELGMTMAGVISRVYREPMANRFLASLAPFIRRHTDDRRVRDIVTDNFRSFFRRNVAPYGRSDLGVGAVGSIAWFFADELAEAAQAEGFRMEKVMRSPMEGLLDYALRAN